MAARSSMRNGPRCGSGHFVGKGASGCDARSLAAPRVPAAMTDAYQAGRLGQCLWHNEPLRGRP